jgi:hypothetical protein
VRAKEIIMKHDIKNDDVPSRGWRGLSLCAGGPRDRCIVSITPPAEALNASREEIFLKGSKSIAKLA